MKPLEIACCQLRQQAKNLARRTLARTTVRFLRASRHKIRVGITLEMLLKSSVHARRSILRFLFSQSQDRLASSGFKRLQAA
ncbi:MAG: hypothetical protein EPN70_06110 [Paraburkholderia sp.]|uniref:hypothetical protein n=1 Tax=Paraburkholderia sp. TaxID=1926495 RepID=UPI0012161ACF|nr:hypothetical protein [Paraburkholderia sp.]TAM06336.1 MAG: hypothetical protein EPN70_06110 [Paraburkholderia sp.]TAM30871.1 MAG: hypothetical protein EPN59_07510 [Paraburkholderia sp.]